MATTIQYRNSSDKYDQTVHADGTVTQWIPQEDSWMVGRYKMLGRKQLLDCIHTGRERTITLKGTWRTLWISRSKVQVEIKFTQQ